MHARAKRKNSLSTGNIKRTIPEKNGSHGIKRTDGKEHAMNTQSTLPSSSGHLLKLTKGPIFIAIVLRDMSAFASVRLQL